MYEKCVLGPSGWQTFFAANHSALLTERFNVSRPFFRRRWPCGVSGTKVTRAVVCDWRWREHWNWSPRGALSAHHALPVQAALSMTPILGTEQQQGSWIVSLCWRHPALGLKVTCCCQRAVCIIIVVVIIIIVISSSIKSLYLGGLPILWVASENPAASYVVRCLLIFILCCAIMFPSFSILMDSHRSLKSLRVCLWTGALCEPLRVMLAGTRTLSTRDHVPLRVAFVR